MKVVVAGALHLDTIVDAPRLPRRDETLVGTGVAYALGGKAGNQAVSAARLGARVAFVGAVGDDGAGDRLLADLERAGVGCAGVQRLHGASGMSVAIVEAGGDYGAVIVSGVNRDIDPGRVAFPDDAGLLVLQNEIPEPVNLALAEAAVARGVPVLLNAAPARTMSDRWPALCDVLVVNRVEAADMTGAADPGAAAESLGDLGYRSVIVTLGGDGLLWRAGGRTAVLPARPAAPVSTHGAGDAFVGALAARLAAGAEAGAALDFAQAAALHVATPPDRRSRVTADAVRREIGRR